MAGKQYDVPPQVLRDIEERTKKRTALKREYFKLMTDPYRHATAEGGVGFDPGLQRFMSMKASAYDYFKPTPKSGAYALGLVVIPIVFYTWAMKMQRDSVEKKFRTGEVAYKDRKFRFI